MTGNTAACSDAMDIVEKIRECICCIATYQLPIVCYLCKEEIKADLWNSGDHR